jgi:hypothetical protein
VNQSPRTPCTCRVCKCPTLLARDNVRGMCSACCRHAQPAAAPLRAADFWNDPALRAARAARDMGAACRAYRHHPANTTAHDGKPIPQEWVAGWIGMSQVQVCRIEKGTNRVRDLDKLVRWAEALKMPRSFAWFELADNTHVSDSGSEPCTVREEEGNEEADVKRRTLLIGGLAASATAATIGVDGEPWERLARAVSNPHRLTEADADQLEHDTVDYFRREELMPARQLSPGLRQHIENLSRVLAGSPPQALRGRLLSSVGEALALYGWFAFDRNDRAGATRFYDLATNAARDAQDDALLACILGYRSYLAEARGDLRQASDMLAAAQEHTRAPSSAATRSWLAAREAEVRASLHEETYALCALDRATTAYDYARPQHERAWTAFFSASRLGSMAVTTYTRLDHPRLGATADGVLGALGPNDAKVKAIILADLATASIHREEYDRGETLGTSALAATTSQEVTIGADRLRSLRQLIEPNLNVVALARLDERLAAALG